MRRLSSTGLTFILASVLVVLFFNQLAFTDLILARGDTYNYFYPYWEARNEAFRMGQLPLWSSDIFMGVPLLANPQLGTFYPPNWLTIPLSVSDAIRYSSLGHLIFAFMGIFLLFRRMVSPAWMPALIASIVFAFGGYLGAHIEQINQLQGLAWLPWLLYCYYRLLTEDKPLQWGILLAIAWALQIFSGHTQTVFMSGIALGIVGLWHGLTTQAVRTTAINLGLLAGVALVTILLAIPQLLPTLELTGMSNRGGGFNVDEATAFSLSPTYLGHALLPNYDATLFTEYISYIGVIALGFALYAMLTPTPNNRQRWLWIIFCIVGLGFALGEFNPLYLLLANLPGFNLFRVPARWLVLYSLGISMLAGYGVALLTEKGINWRKLGAIFLPLIVLMLLARFAPARQIDMTGSTIATVPTMMIWGLTMFVLSGLFFLRKSQYLPIFALIAITVELFLASQVMWYNRLVPPDVYDGQRFTISHMLAELDNDVSAPSRMLSISERQFDVGDTTFLQTRFDSLGLDTYAQETAFTAIKNQELIAPNLPMTWGIPSVDGYGGGVLPTIYYTQYTSLLLPPEQNRITDGRLVEELVSPECRGACVPPIAQLQMTDTRYIITDRTFDVPYNEVFYDTSLAEFWVSAPVRPDFIFDEVRILSSSAIAEEAESFDFLGGEYYILALSWEDFVDLFPVEDNTILAVSVVNTQTNTFQQLTPPPFERVLSSDIKIYRLPLTYRAETPAEFAYTPDNWQGHEDALIILRQNPETLVLHDAPVREPAIVQTAIADYTSTHLRMTVSADAPTYLYLADAYYPGWQATVDGVDVPVYRANVMFRAIPIPAGTTTVEFNFVPCLWYNALIFGGIVWILATLAGFFAYRKASR